MQINAPPLSDKLAGEKLRDAELLGVQATQGESLVVSLAMISVYKLVLARRSAH